MGVLDGKAAIVTGAGQGIGRGIALALAAEGAAVAVIDLRVHRAKDVASDIVARGGTARAFPCDVRRSSEVDETVAQVVDTFGTVDVLVNNAMAAQIGVPLEEVDDDQLMLALMTGPAASLWFMRACFPHLRGGGRVINLRSGSEPQAMPGYGAYVTAKAAVGGLTRSAAREWGRHGITVNAIAPFSLSPSAEAFLTAQPGGLDTVYDQLSIPRSGDAETEIGRAAVYLAGPDAAFVTGCTLAIDGGGTFFS
jgi:NAD(P)-dependent dehydrogenase (short-subunit alcohol dehydrogenase family)